MFSLGKKYRAAMKNPTANKGFGVLETTINIHVSVGWNTGIQCNFVSKGFRELLSSSSKLSTGVTNQEPKYYLKTLKTYFCNQSMIFFFVLRCGRVYFSSPSLKYFKVGNPEM